MLKLTVNFYINEVPVQRVYQFDNNTQLNAFMAEKNAQHYFGKLAGEYQVINLNPTELATATSHRQDTNGVHFVTIPNQFNTTTEDISAQVSAEKRLSDRKQKRQFGEHLIDIIAEINDGKNLTVEQVDAFMANPVVSSIREHLYAGNLDTAIYKMQNEDLSALFSDAEKNAVILQIQNFLASL